VLETGLSVQDDGELHQALQRNLSGSLKGPIGGECDAGSRSRFPLASTRAPDEAHGHAQRSSAPFREETEAQTDAGAADDPGADREPAAGLPVVHLTVPTAIGVFHPGEATGPDRTLFARALMDEIRGRLAADIFPALRQRRWGRWQ
jgi:hypothetical protein